MPTNTIKPVEYTSGQPLERYSAERRRRGLMAENISYGAASGAAAFGAAGLSNVKLAGTNAGQAALKTAHAHAKVSAPESAPLINNAIRAGQWARRRRNSTALGVVGLAGISTGTGMMSRVRSNEEAGISQGIGRIKAGEMYDVQRRRALNGAPAPVSKAGPLRMALMASDYDLSDPRIRRGARFAWNHKRKIAAGAGGLAAAGMLAERERGHLRYVRDREQLRSIYSSPPNVKKAAYERRSRVNPVRATEFAAGAGLLAAGVGRSGIVGRSVARGAKHARANNSPRVAEALDRAASVSRSVSHGVVSDQDLRQIKMVEQALRRVPEGVRGDVATIAGALLVANSIPVAQNEYRQIGGRYGSVR